MRLVATVFVTRSATARFSRCLACLDVPLAAAVSTACGGTERLLAAPEVEPTAAEAVRTELARLALVGKVGKVGKETATLPGTHLICTLLDRIAPGARS